MGSSYYVYVGPYIRCKNPSVPTPVKKERSCTNDQCPRYAKEDGGKFCKECGAKIADVTVTKDRPRVDFWKVTEEINERLAGYNREYAKPGIDLYVGNIDWGKTRKLQFSRDAADKMSEIPIGKMEIADEVTAFSSFFQHEIDVLFERYGAENVSIGWGILDEFM